VVTWRSSNAFRVDRVENLQVPIEIWLLGSREHDLVMDFSHGFIPFFDSIQLQSEIRCGSNPGQKRDRGGILGFFFGVIFLLARKKL